MEENKLQWGPLIGLESQSCEIVREFLLIDLLVTLIFLSANGTISHSGHHLFTLFCSHYVTYSLLKLQL